MDTRLWLLEAVEDREVWDIYVGFVIRAADEAAARRIAEKKAESEWQHAPGYWLDASCSSCEVVAVDGEPAVILADYSAA